MSSHDIAAARNLPISLVSPALVTHRVSEGNRPSSTILAQRVLPNLDAATDAPLIHDSLTNILITRLPAAAPGRNG